MKTAVALLCLLSLPCASLAQIFELPDIIRPPFRYWVPRLLVPAVDADTASFAYLQDTSSGQSLELARITRAFPSPVATSIATLATEDGVNETILDIYASPDNHWLAVYTFQDTGAGFVDHNITFYNMRNGDSLGLRNEHAFSSLDESLAPSERLDEFRDALADASGPDDELPELDYSVVTEGANIATPTYQWNADGTFGLTFELDVLAVFEGGGEEFIGTEAFTMNIAVAPSGLTTVDFDETRTPATFPPVFALTPVDSPEEIIRFNSSPVSFRSYYYSYFAQRWLPFYSYRHAVMTEGNIPRRYRNAF